MFANMSGRPAGDNRWRVDAHRTVSELKAQPPRILILSASAGAGHVRAAQAIEQAVCAIGTCDVRHVDALEHTTKIFRRLYQKAYIDMVNHAPEVLGGLYDHLDKPWKYERRRLAWDQLNTRPFVELIKSYDPAWVVCTHFLPAEIVSWLKARRRLRARLAVVVTDFDVHAMWLYRHVDRYFVALDETREHLASLGIPAEKITVSGIPIDPTFAAAARQTGACGASTGSTRTGRRSSSPREASASGRSNISSATCCSSRIGRRRW